MLCVKHLIATKGPEVWSVAPEDSVLDAIKLLAEKHIGALPVMRAGELVGIVSERDYARKVILRGRTVEQTRVREIMSAPVRIVTTDDTVQQCMETMTQYRIRHLPVVERGRVIGIISIGDVVKAVMEEQQNTITELERYIAS
jgi:CBS domain-containing protein